MESGAKMILITSNGDEVSKSIALHLARMGFRLVLMGDDKCLREVAEEIRLREVGLGIVKVVGLDMEEESEGPFTRAVQRAFAAFPNSTLDAFVHCFSYPGKSEIHLELLESEFKKIVKVNLTAAWHLLNAVARRMRDNGSGGSIVLLTSIIGAERGIYPGSAAYASCSAALLQLARVSALEIGKYKIRVNAIARGLHIGDEFLESVGKERAQRLVNEAAPLARWLDPKNDVISTVAYLISDGSKYMTGTTIFVDGAQSITRPRLRSYM